MFPLNYQFESRFSTQDEIEKYIFQNDSGVALYTFNQMQGRGQYGNQWIPMKGQNLAYSLMVKEDLITTPLSLINFYTALLIQEFIANLTESDVFVKWPNDIIINGKKVGGILIEKRKLNNFYYFIIGIGINILQTEFGDLNKAGSILSQTSKEINPTTFTKEFHNYFSKQLLLEKLNLLECYNQHLFKKDQVALFVIHNDRQNGIIRKVDDDGYIWIELEKNGLSKFFHKEIEMLY